MSDLAPIVLFVYNRPDHTRRTLTTLAANSLAAESDLIIYADGAKKPTHDASVAQVREVARVASGFKSVKLIERSANMGLANSIITGVTEVCASRGRTIVVEDDLIVAPRFLDFLNAGLRRYESETDVMQVSGYSYPAHGSSAPPTFFLPMVSCWGWATWARAWSRFDAAMSFLERLNQHAVLRRRFNLDGAYDYFGMACQQAQGRIDSWGIRWQLSLFANNGLVLYPRETLVTNAGVDASGTHGAGRPSLQRAVSSDSGGLETPTWPGEIAINAMAFEQVRQLLLCERPGIVRRIIQRVRS